MKSRLFALFLSGVAGLTLEIMWLRVLSLNFGLTIHAVGMASSIFVGGLGIGAALAGPWIDRKGNPFRIYAALEVVTGLYALVVALTMRPALLLANVVPSDPLSPLPNAAAVALAVIMLLPPSALMGASFTAFVRGHVACRESRGVALPYGVNSLGAAVGCVLAGFHLLPALGVTFATLAACVLYFGSALLVYLTPVDDPLPASGPPPTVEATPRLSPLLLCAFLAGFIAVLHQVLWSTTYRDFLPVFTSTVRVLFVMLLGMAAGGALAEGMRSRRELLRTSLWLAPLVVVGMSALQLSIVLAPIEPVKARLTAEHTIYLACLSVGLGLIFPALCDVMLERREGGPSATSLSYAYAANTLGAVLGGLGASFVFIPWLGAVNTTCLAGTLALLLATLLAVGLKLHVDLRWCLPVLGVPLVLASHASPASPGRGRIVFNEVSSEAHTTVWQLGSGEHVLVTNGANISPHGQYTRGLAALLLAPQRRRVLYVGFGTGMSLRAFLEAPGVEAVDCVEIDGQQFRTAPYFGTDSLLQDPRLRLAATDARLFLRRTRERYDIVCVDTFGFGYNSECYTLEFMALCRNVMSPRGVFTIKLHPETRPLERELLDTLATVFPHAYKCKVVDFEALVGANEEIVSPSASQLEDLLPQTRAWLDRSDARALQAELSLGRIPVALSRPEGARLHTDFWPLPFTR